jgi:hypothetical protein
MGEANGAKRFSVALTGMRAPVANLAKLDLTPDLTPDL